MQIAITGIGIISALGKGVDVHRRLLPEGGSALRPPQLLDTCHHEWPVGEVRFSNDELKDSLGLTDTVLTRNILLGMTALREAVADARLGAVALATTPLVNGTTVGGMDVTERYFAQWQNGDYRHINVLRQHEADETSRWLCDRLGLKSFLTVSTACSSALNAVIHGAGLIRTGAANQVIVGGTEAMTRFHLNGFASLGILSTSVCRPFQEDRDGINLGEGAAYLVLENAEQARQRGVTVYGYLAGYGNSCDAYHQTASSPEGEGAWRAMQTALSMGGLCPQDIGYINAHGTATVNNDASELQAIGRLFGDRLPVIESTKPMTGHTTSASGSIEAVFTLMRMHDRGYKRAMSNAFGFGGNDSSIVLSLEPVDLPEVDRTPSLRTTGVCVSTGELDYKDMIPALQARRMTPMIRQLLVVAKQALEQAHVACPDGIVTGTRWGGMIPTVQLLNQLNEGEKNLSPALFMNSTHNSAAGTLARFLQCRDYNSTVVSQSDPFGKAQEDAQLQLLTGKNKSVLVCSVDEVDSPWQDWGERVGIHFENKVKAQVLCLD